METALDPRRRRGRYHKHSRPPSSPKPRMGGEAQAPCGAAGPRRSARIMACSGWRGGIPRNQSSAYHYMPLSESGAPGRLPQVKQYWSEDGVRHGTAHHRGAAYRSRTDGSARAGAGRVKQSQPDRTARPHTSPAPRVLRWLAKMNREGGRPIPYAGSTPDQMTFQIHFPAHPV